MLEQAGALFAALFIFSKVVGVIKALLFAKDVVSKVAYDEREDYLVAHVKESHPQAFKWCVTNQCASL